MNPRRPTPPGPQPGSPLARARVSQRGVIGARLGPITDNDVLEKFYEYCLETASRRVCRDYVNYLRKPLNIDNKTSVLAWKKYAKFIGNEELWLKLKVKPSGIDIYVPDDEKILDTLETVCRSQTPLCWIYKLLIYSGLRLVEVVKVLNEGEPDKWITNNNFYKYPLSWKRGTKQVLYMYSLEKPPILQKLNPRNISKQASRLGLVAPKYLRKWVATKMLSLGILEEIVNFIQGRIPQTILSKHYLKLTTLADQYYPTYAKWLKQHIFKTLEY